METLKFGKKIMTVQIKCTELNGTFRLPKNTSKLCYLCHMNLE